MSWQSVLDGTAAIYLFTFILTASITSYIVVESATQLHEQGKLSPKLKPYFDYFLVDRPEQPKKLSVKPVTKEKEPESSSILRSTLFSYTSKSDAKKDAKNTPKSPLEPIYEVTKSLWKGPLSVNANSKTTAFPPQQAANVIVQRIAIPSPTLTETLKSPLAFLSISTSSQTSPKPPNPSVTKLPSLFLKKAPKPPVNVLDELPFVVQLPFRVADKVWDVSVDTVAGGINLALFPARFTTRTIIGIFKRNNGKK